MPSERRIGELVRDGQERGEILKAGEGNRPARRSEQVGPTEAAGVHARELVPLYVMGDAPAEDFEAAVTTATARGRGLQAVRWASLHAAAWKTWFARAG